MRKVALRRSVTNLATWDVRSLVAAFAGIDPLLRAHSEFDFPPLTYGAVANWLQRGSAPATRVAELLVTLQKRNGECDPFDFIVIDRREGGSAKKQRRSSSS